MTSAVKLAALVVRADELSLRKVLKVLQHNEIRDAMETPGMYASLVQSGDSKIEEILRRAREIHRQHGGVFGYDFEDWSEAWRELPQSGSGPDPQFAVENGAELLLELETEVCE